MFAIFTILHHGSTYDFSWISAPHAVDATTTSPASFPASSPASSTGHGTCCLVGTTYLDPERRAHLQQQILAAAQRLSFGGQRSTQESSDLFRGLGTLLFTQLIPDAIQQQLVTLPAGSTLQLVTDDLNWPWELLHDGQEFLALRHNVTRLPRLERSQPLRTHAAADKPAKVTCLLLGNPTSNLPGTEDEIAAIEDILFVARERVTYRSLFGPHITADYLQDQLTTEHYDLVHYAGHATPDALVLADAPFQMARLRAALRHHPVVILNACATAQAALVDADLATMSRNAQSLASGFMQAGAAAVIGMLWPIPDAAATRFGEVFYHHLTAGAPIGTALRLSRIELRRQDPHGIAWLAPVLYGNGQHQPVPVALKAGAGTVMAVRFVAPPVDQFQGGQRNAETLARSLALLAQRVTQYGGTLSQMTEAGLLATFGLHQPSDNSALNAIYAARDLATQLANWGVTPPAIAIAAGDLATAAAAESSSSSALARSSLLLGTAVREAEWAATLAASGQILINELVRERSAPHFHAQPWQSAGSKSAPAITDSHLYELLSTPLSVVPGSLALDFSVTVGREAELTQLMAIWRDVQHGRGQAIGISGEAGIGKSHLLQTFRRRIEQDWRTQGDSASGETAQGNEVHWLQVGCTIDVQNTSYGLLTRLFRSLLELPPEAPAAQRRELLQARFPHSTPADVALVADLLGLAPDSTPRQERAVYQHQLSRLLTHLVVEKIVERPLVLVVEDAHWSDAASLEVITLLANHVEDGRILFCLLYRPTWQPPWVGRAYFQTIQLKALGRLDRQQLYKDLLDTAELPVELVALLERSSGNPLFLTEILTTLLHKGLLVPVTGEEKEWQTTGILLARDLPDSVHRVVDLRLDQLDAPTWEVLAMAALFGAGFTPTMLTWVMTLPLDELYAQLALLTEQDFLRGSLLSEEYAFRHELIRDVVYSRIPLPQRQLWHRQVAEALEAQGREVQGIPATEGDRRAVVTLLAHHYYHSLVDGSDVDEGQVRQTHDQAVVEKAVTNLIQSGQDALARYAGQEATAQFQRAATLARFLPDEHVDQVPIYTGLGDAYHLRSQHQAAQQAYRKAQGLLHTQPLRMENRLQAARLARLLARLHMWAAEYSEANAWIETGLAYVQHCDRAECRAAEALLAIQTGSICINQGDYTQAITACRKGLELAALCQDQEAAAEGNVILGASMFATGDYRASLEYYATSLALYQEQQNLYQIHRVQMNIGLSLFYQSEWPAALEYYKQVLPFWEEIGEENLLAGICINMGLAEKYLGNWSAAQRYYQRALALCDTIGNQKWAALTHSNWGALAVTQESWPVARQHLDAALAILMKNEMKDFLSGVYAQLALVELAEGQAATALSLAEQAVASAVSNQEQVPHAIALRTVGQVLMQQTDYQTALDYLARSRKILGTLGNRYELARTDYQLALLHAAMHAHDAAREACAAALATFQTLSAQKDLEQTQQLDQRLSQR